VTHILNPTRIWECPSCRLRDRTTEAQPHTRFHSCKALNGLTAPMVDVTHRDLDPSAQRHRIVEREDYVAGELVQTDDRGRPVMALITDRADGSNDCTVYAPAATGTHKE